MLSAASRKIRSNPNGVSRQTIAELRLREVLLSGELPPGRRLAEQPLAVRLGVSRTPMRLALAALAEEGLVQEYPTGGYVVSGFQLSDVFDSIELRGTLEGLAVRLAIERGHTRSAESLDGLRAAVVAIDRGLKGVRRHPEEALAVYIAQNDLFHSRLLALANSSVLQREMERVMRLPFAAPSTGFIRAQIGLERSQEILRIGQMQHYAILDALENHEAARAESLLREHSRIARKNLEIALESGVAKNIPGLHLIQQQV